MKRAIPEVRLTLYSFISAIESDLRGILREELIPSCNDLSFIKDPDNREKIVKRFEKDNPGLAPESNIDSLIDFLYFQESYKVILENRESMPAFIAREITAIVPDLDKISSIRNRVMHNRPLLAGDFSHVYSFVDKLIPQKRIEWSTCQRTLSRLDEDPSFVFSVTIPEEEEEKSYVFHNLPLPDFDESGFIGRRDDTEQVKKLLLGNNRVVSILGDGGIGKSALALKIAYDIIDMGDKCPFESVLWVSAKTNMLTHAGIETIRNSLRDYSGLIDNITKEVGAQVRSTSENVNEILDYLDEFEVLIIIDNLETILDENVRYFIREAQQRCKIVITSRVGLGELEFPRKVSGLSESESSILIRTIARVRNSDVLLSIRKEQLSDISRELHFNPLAIKWFVNSVDSGRTPSEVLNKKDDLLNYCMSNVYENLSDDAKVILSTILSARKRLNDAELSFLSALAPIDMRKALSNLFITTFVRREVPDESEVTECVYSITDFARNYLVTQHPVEKTFVQNVKKKMKELSMSFEKARVTSSQIEFHQRSLEIRNQNEKVISRYINEALKLSSPGTKEYESALEQLHLARDIVPNYFEIYRVSAFIKATQGDLLGAEEDYKSALELEPDNVRLLYFYTGFLMFQMDDVSESLVYAKKALELRPGSPETVMMYARCTGYLGNYDEAVNLLEGALRGNVPSTKSQKRITTVLIDFYRRWASTDVDLDSDLRSATMKLRKATVLFKMSEKSSLVDHQMVNAFSEVISLLLRYCGESKDESAKQNAYDIFKEYESYLVQSFCYAHMIRTIEKEYLACMIVDDSERYIGTVARFWKDRTFAFLESEAHGDLYFDRGSMIDNSEWIQLNAGVKLEYALGSNRKGQCAIGVRISRKSDE